MDVSWCQALARSAATGRSLNGSVGGSSGSPPAPTSKGSFKGGVFLARIRRGQFFPSSKWALKLKNYSRYVDMSLIPIWSAGTVFDSLLENQKWWGDLGGRVPWGDWNGDDHVEQVTNVAEEQVVGKCILKQDSGI